MTTPCLILVARSETRLQTYREALEPQGFTCQHFSDLRDVASNAARMSYSGVLLDMPIIIKASQHEKSLIEDVLKALPSAYINIAPATDSIKLLVATGSHGQARNLEEFLAICKAFSPHPVRPNDRVPLHLNAVLTHLEHTYQPEQTVTLNVSGGGCFLFSTCPDTRQGDTVQINFIGLADQTPIIAVVRWSRPWGSYHQMPGIGVTFEQISDAQRRQINELMIPFRPR